jgi:hypothetical protein
LQHRKHAQAVAQRSAVQHLVVKESFVYFWLLGAAGCHYSSFPEKVAVETRNLMDFLS